MSHVMLLAPESVETAYQMPQAPGLREESHDHTRRMSRRQINYTALQSLQDNSDPIEMYPA